MTSVMEPVQDPIVCPECRVRKCGNCSGGAWDFDGDEPAICDCWKHGHWEP